MKIKKKPTISRHKKLSGEKRLQAGKSWINKYEGKDIVKGYSKHFAVDLFCAVKELKLLGIEISEEYIGKLKIWQENIMRQRAREKELKQEKERLLKYPDSNDVFYFIAGYTPGGAPYGTTWEEMGMEPYEEIRD